MKVSRNGLKPIPEKQMPEWARVASPTRKGATIEEARANLEEAAEMVLQANLDLRTKFVTIIT